MLSTKLEEELHGNRPMGKKKACQAEGGAKLHKSFISEVVAKQEHPNNTKSGCDSSSLGSASLGDIGGMTILSRIS
jgi:hypothetical protein